MSTRPPGDDVYEVLVSGDDSVGIMNKTTAVLAQENVNIVSTHGQVDEAGKSFVNVFFCEMGKAKVGADALKKKLEALPFVREVRVEQLKGLMHERFMFPFSGIYAGRVLIVGANAFMEIEGRLVEIFGSAGEVMAYEQGRAYAISTLADLDAYRKKVGAAWDLENISSWIRAQGWARAEIAEVPEGYLVKLTSLPRSGEEGRNGGLSRFLTGMTVGMLELHAGQRLGADPTVYEAEADRFTFKVRKQSKSAR